MIVFKNGKYIGGRRENIINACDGPDIGDKWDCSLKDECWILEIPQDLDDMQLFNPYQIDLFFIPKATDMKDDAYNIFWNSNETYVFDSFGEALKYIANYKGNHEKAVEELYGRILESFLVEETVAQFLNLDELDKDFDVDFMNELEELVYYKDISMNSILTSMKLFMLDKYRLGIQEQRLSRLN